MTTWRLDVRAVFGLAAVALVWSVAYGAFQVSGHRSAVAVGAAIDVSATAALALYVIAVRGGHLPRWTLGVTAALGLSFAKLVLSRTDGVAHAAMMTAVLLELGLFALLAVRGRRALRGFRSARAGGAMFADALAESFVAGGFPVRLAHVLATELGLLASSVTGWRRPVRAPGKFTVHRDNGWPLYAGVFVFLTIVETTVLHIILTVYASPAVAWTAIGLSLYGILWIIGDALALRHGGVTIGEHALELAMGVRWRGRIPWTLVASVERGPAPPGAVDVSILGANVVLRLHAPCSLHGLLGRRREGSILALSIDGADAFVAAASARLVT